MHAIHPSLIRTFASSGSSDMGDVDDVDSKARFSLDVDRWVLAWIRGGFTGTEATADLAIRLDSRLALPSVIDSITSTIKTSPFDFTLKTMQLIGSGSRMLNVRIDPDEYPGWTFQRGDILVLEWTNPGTQKWAIEVGLFDAADLERV